MFLQLILNKKGSKDNQISLENARNLVEPKLVYALGAQIKFPEKQPKQES